MSLPTLYYYKFIKLTFFQCPSHYRRQQSRSVLVFLPPKQRNTFVFKHVHFQNKHSAENTLIRTITSGKILNESCIQWDQSIQIPILYDVQMDFQIYQKHEFGYNPQEIDQIMYGKMMFIKGNEKYNNWQIYAKNSKKVGFLSLNIKGKHVTNDKLIHIQQQKQKQKQQQIISINSIVVSLQKLKAKRGYAVITIGQQVKRTSGSMSRTGELVFIEKYEINKKLNIIDNAKMMIELFLKNNEDGKEDEKIATTQIKINHQNKIQRKLLFIDEQGNNIGEGFIDAKILKKNDVETERAILGMLKKSFNERRVSKQKFQNQSSTRDLSHSNHSFTLRSNRQTSLDYSRLHHNISIVNTNQNIKIPQQKRFFSSRDPANNKCSYLKEQSFEFKEKRVEKYYRGASIGYGLKKDFAEDKKTLPGVGKYKLPSIWDRY